jgi:hypothetical protein
MLALTSKPWASMKSFDQRIFDTMSSNPTNLALVELQVLTFCFVEMEQMVPEPRAIVAPV